MSAYKCHHSHHAQVQSQKFCTLGFRQQEYCEQPNHDERPESYNIKKCNNNNYYFIIIIIIIIFIIIISSSSSSSISIIIIIIIIIIIAGDKRSPQS